ncbi:hypothetical protein R5R35_008117 [Gryllus longicercus]|uniref:Uncharacterized protein n=1 Tax=Gryllus longicercus TaxID=2509291 RepID=A0AAN9V2H2_9ORTH
MHLGDEGFRRFERMRWSPTSSSARMSGSVEVSTVEASTVEAFTVEASTVEESTVEVFTIESSTVESSTVEASTVEVFTIEASTVEASTVVASTVEASTFEASTVEASVIEQLPPRTQHTEHSQSGNRKKPSMPLYTPPPMRQHYPRTQPDPSRLRETTELQVIDMSTSMMQNPESKSDNLKVCSYNIPCQSLNKNDSQDYDDSEVESNDLDEEFAKVGLSPISEKDEAERGDDGKESWYSENDK